MNTRLADKGQEEGVKRKDWKEGDGEAGKGGSWRVLGVWGRVGEGLDK